MDRTSHWDDRYNKQYYQDFVRYYANNKPDYSSSCRVGDADEVSPANARGSNSPVVLLAGPRRHKLPLGQLE